jgi:fatty-acyl-CoA synthase
MRLSDYLDRGASLDPSAPCLTMRGRTRSYHDVQRLSWLVGQALARSGIGPGDKVAVLSGNDPVAFSCIFGIARAGAIWCFTDVRDEPARTLKVLDHLDCSCLIFQNSFAPLVRRISRELPKVRLLVCVDQDPGMAPAPPASIPLREWLAGVVDTPFEPRPAGEAAPADQAPSATEVVAIRGAGTGLSDAKGVLLTCGNIEAMAEATLMGYPFTGRPVFLAITPLTRGLAMFTFPVLTLGGELILLPDFEVSDFLSTIEQCRVTHAFLPSSLLGAVLDHPDLPGADLSSLQCLWYDGGDGIPAARLADAITRLGPVMGPLFGQPEVLVISGLAPGEHFHADGTLAVERLASAGRPTALATVRIMDQQGMLLPAGQRGEIVVRGPLVTTGYYADPARSAAVSRYGWHHTGEFGYLDTDNYLHIVQRARDLIATGRFNVYSAEVERALQGHPAVRSCAVMAAPDATWGERVTAVIQARPGFRLVAGDVRSFLRERLGGRAPRQLEVWSDGRHPRLGSAIRHLVKSLRLRRIPC